MIDNFKNDNNGPIKRNASLQCLSHDHHYGLLLCWKIRTGLKKTDHERIKRYTDYFFKEHLLPHFKIEEKYIFPLLGEESELVQQATKDHLKLKALFEDTTNVLQSLMQIEVELEKHIRMEERVLFKELQRLVPESQLAEALQSHNEKKDDTWEDKFWETK
ncbi:hemerythrin domain-containing protein [Aurantibacillus circumpalustris]|uniref:hemerythrin domain-containing protein n=1 Tax=Aurantibacillus circumpalustris TaxID=3036359 RepID=UPI00295C3278|nr:hemerythrin domain-containing protein [Aurantibacillus circumpalustris]